MPPKGLIRKNTARPSRPIGGASNNIARKTAKKTGRTSDVSRGTQSLAPREILANNFQLATPALRPRENADTNLVPLL
jgi:hypothetical protein